jgi:hypothetical protein
VLGLCKEGPHKGDPSCPESKPKDTPSTGTGKTGTGKLIEAKHGLDLATAQAINELNYAEKDKHTDPTKIIDGTQITSNGEAVTTFCDHPRCRRFTKGLHMHSQATGHGNGGPQAYLAQLPAPPEVETPETPQDGLAHFQDPPVTEDLCLPTSAASSSIPSAMVAKTPPFYQLGWLTRNPGAFMAFKPFIHLAWVPRCFTMLNGSWARQAGFWPERD